MLTPVVSTEVFEAIASGRPVVALESTIFSHLGLPSPYNAEALDRCTRVLRDAGVVPAITAVLDGVIRLGLRDDQLSLERGQHGVGKLPKFLLESV